MLVEVTDTVSVPYTTGLQRVARELLTRLPRSGSPSFRPVRWSPACSGYRDLTAEETRVLADPPERLPRTTRLAASLPAPAATAVRRALATRPAREARAALRGFTTLRAERDRTHLCLRPLGDAPDQRRRVLLDLEAAWNDPAPRTTLLAQQATTGVRSGALIADVLPLLHPEWFDDQLVREFTTFLDGHLCHSELFLCISERTRVDLLHVAEQRGVTRPLRTEVIPLGADLADADDAADPRTIERFASLPDRYLLLVGTLEPRKNQQLALDLLDGLRDTHPDVALVLVGKRGWKVDALIRRIEHHPGRGTRLFWFEEVDDRALQSLYRGATVCLTPAVYEGLGVTVMEALHLGTPVIASTGGALPEAGGSAAEYADPDDTAGWIQLVRAHLDDPAHHAQARRRAAAWRPPTWDDAADAVVAAVREVFGS